MILKKDNQTLKSDKEPQSKELELIENTNINLSQLNVKDNNEKTVETNKKFIFKSFSMNNSDLNTVNRSLLDFPKPYTNNNITNISMNDLMLKNDNNEKLLNAAVET